MSQSKSHTSLLRVFSRKSSALVVWIGWAVLFAWAVYLSWLNRSIPTLIVSLFAVATMILFICFIWWNASLLFRAEQQRLRDERRLAVQYAATRILAESPSVADATQKILRSICDTLGWQAGAFWAVDDAAKVIRCEQVHATTPATREFAAHSQTLAFPLGTELPGLNWQRRTPVWIENLTTDSDFSRGTYATRADLRSGLGFPIQHNGTIYGVMEFFSDRADPRDGLLIEMLSVVGGQIGQFVERKHAEEQLKQTSADLARSDTELLQFAYVASHDLSGPLQIITGYLQLLKNRHRESLDAEEQEFIGHAVDGAQRLKAMIHDLLTYLRAGSHGAGFQPTNCEQVLAAALQNLRFTIEETGTVVEHEPLPTVSADAVQLTQVFQNLLGNAIKFRGQTPPRIDIGARRKDNEWIISVKDNGIGIEPKDFERIFVLFQRLHTSQEHPGTGIGLAICKKIIEHHGGRIWVESEAGKGTTFFLTLPARTVCV